MYENKSPVWYVIEHWDDLAVKVRRFMPRQGINAGWDVQDMIFEGYHPDGSTLYYQLPKDAIIFRA
jgi:hypothetical protein